MKSLGYVQFRTKEKSYSFHTVKSQMKLLTVKFQELRQTEVIQEGEQDKERSGM